MKAYDLMELAGKNLREAMLRNSLTTLGIGVGIASLVGMLSLGIGLQALADKQLGRAGIFDSIAVSSRADWRTAEERTSERTIQTGEARVVDETARREIAQIPKVLEVYPAIRSNVEVRFAREAEERPHFTSLTAVTESARDLDAFTEMQGEFFSSQTAAEGIILGEFARELLDLPNDENNDAAKRNLITPEQAKQLIGKEITIRYAERQQSAADPEEESFSSEPADDENFSFSVVRQERKVKIVGVIDNDPYGGLGPGSRSRMILPMEYAEGLNMMQAADLRTLNRPSKGKSYSTLIVRVGGPQDVQEVQEKIRNLGFTTYSVIDAARGLRRFFVILDLFLSIFGSLALTIAALGIINTLVMAILERRREIGIMKAIGASDADVKQLFFVEAGAMGLLGGILGVALGWVIGRIINVGTNVYLAKIDLPPEDLWVSPWWLVAGALAFAVIVSLVSGLYPASRAAKLDPVQALRHD